MGYYRLKVTAFPQQLGDRVLVVAARAPRAPRGSAPCSCRQEEAAGRGAASAVLIETFASPACQSDTIYLFFSPRRWQETPSDLFSGTRGIFRAHSEAAALVTAQHPANLHGKVFYGNRTESPAVMETGEPRGGRRPA